MPTGVEAERARLAKERERLAAINEKRGPLRRAIRKRADATYAYSERFRRR